MNTHPAGKFSEIIISISIQRLIHVRCLNIEKMSLLPNNCLLLGKCSCLLSSVHVPGSMRLDELKLRSISESFKP